MEKFKKSYKTKSSTFGVKAFIKNIALAFLIFVGIFIVFSILISLFLYNTPNPTAFLDVATYASLFLSSFIACFFLSKKNGQKYLLGSLIFGTVVIFIIFSVSIFTGSKIFSVSSLLKLASLIFCAIGGLLGAKRERRIKRRKH